MVYAEHHLKIAMMEWRTCFSQRNLRAVPLVPSQCGEIEDHELQTRGMGEQHGRAAEALEPEALDDLAFEGDDVQVILDRHVTEDSTANWPRVETIRGGGERGGGARRVPYRIASGGKRDQ